MGEQTMAHASPGAREHAGTSSLIGQQPAASRSDTCELSASHAGNAADGHGGDEAVSHSSSLERSNSEHAVAAPAVCLTSCSSTDVEGELT